MKDKMRCASCGAMFKPVKSSQTKCERCEKREREQRAAARHAGDMPQRSASVAPQPVRISGPAASLLGSTAPASRDVAPPPPEPTTFGMAAWRDEQRREHERLERERRERERLEREQARARERATSAPYPTPFGPGRSGVHSASQSGAHTQPYGARPQGKFRTPRPERPPQPPHPPRPSRPPKAIPARIELTDDLRSRIETRYLELARPVEFDGIRTRIATEMELPKSLVKKAISDLRDRMKLPSWWDLQAYTGPETELERIRMAYIPLLPLPEVGVHKKLADELGLDPRVVYQGIRRVRAEMRLPQYNPPELRDHSGDIAPSQAAPGV